MKLPNADRAIVDVRKLREYCLSHVHPRGRHKARVFAAALGLTADHVEELRDAILAALRRRDARLTGQDFHGLRYRVEFTITRSGRRARVRSHWIVRRGEDFPRLVSCYVT